MKPSAEAEIATSLWEPEGFPQLSLVALAATGLTLWPWIRPGRGHLGPLPPRWILAAQHFAFVALKRDRMVTAGR
jgi:hypothetical protein